MLRVLGSLRARRTTLLCASLISLGVPGVAAAGDEQGAGEPADRFSWSIAGETYAELFRRALLPGPNGALVERDTAVPLYKYVFLRAQDIDTSWRKDSIDVELAAWSRVWLGEDQPTESRLDGDVQTASVRYRHGPLSLRFGRQHAAGGAARYVRFDGVTLDGRPGAGLEIEGYGGYTVLPRWDDRPGYHHLGAAADSLLRDPEALPEPDRSGYWLAGGRFGWASSRAHAAVSFHEQAEPEGLSRRTLGLDGRGLVLKDAAIGGTALLDIDALRLQDARLWVDATPTPALDLSAEVLHTEPALFLSRQSVLSVFSADAYEEAGGSGVLRVTDRFTVEGGGWVQFYDESHRGARGEIGIRALPGAGRRTIARVTYARVLAVGNGYHSLRTSLSRRILAALSGTLEVHGYLYDEAIRERRTSVFYSGTLSYQATPALNLLWGASLAQSPYASVDAQTIVRASYAFDVSAGSAAR
jgi:hypothetical protein